MKTIVQLLFLISISSTVFGQDISGQWYGTLNVYGTKLRIVFHISKTGTRYAATMDSPDQGAKDIAVTATNFNYPDVKIELSKIGVVYEGTMSGSQITGNWKQSGQSFPLVLSKEMEISGEWNASYKQVMFVFHIEKQDGKYLSTMDISSRNLMGIKTKATTFSDDRLHIDGINFEYNGKFRSDSLQIEGIFTEGGNSIPLNLKPGKTATSQPRNRPQEPKRPYPYQEEEVFFENSKDGITLAGTLTLPNKSGTCPVVILITGSGPQNRDEEIYGHKPFLVLADHLTRQGIAVLRCDDRGVNQSTGEFADATTKDFATDIVSAVKYLKSRKEIDGQNIGLIGHSEGGIIAPLVANQTKDVAFIVLLAGTGIPGSEISVIQSRTLRGFDVPGEEAYEQYIRKAIEIASANKDVTEVRKELKDFYLNSSLLKKLLPPNIDRDTFIHNLVNTRTTPWMRYFYTYNPADEIKKVTCPVLSLNGSRDMQVPAAINQAAIKKALENGYNKDFLVKELPGLNHFFQESKTGLPGEYPDIQQTFSPVALEEITNWIKGHVK